MNNAFLVTPFPPSFDPLTTKTTLCFGSNQHCSLCFPCYNLFLQQKAKTWQQHKISRYLDTVAAINLSLEAQYKDEDRLLNDELISMRGENMFSSFYDAINASKEYHQKFPNIAGSDYQAKVVEEECNVGFSGEEVFGKYLDLHAFFLKYCNIPNIPSRDQDYLQYLDKFNSFFFIPEATKSNRAYISYVNDLWEYLKDFFRRVQPLIALDEKEWKEQFDTLWAEGKVAGWKAARNTGEAKEAPQQLRLGLFNDPTELEALGLDRLKDALEALNMKCGGSLKERAERLWSVRGKKPEEIPQKLRAKPAPAAAAASSSSSSSSTQSSSNGSTGAVNGHNDVGSTQKQTAWSEFKIVRLCDLMIDVVTATRKHAEKQQSRTAEEKSAEIEEEEFGLLPDANEEEEKDDDDEGPAYNPLDLPLGWDGKPIPYWLYKLHGLSVEYKCEICGNQIYKGRRVFDQHFQQWRHAHGMRCLGVPNTKHFHDITKISDVLELYAKISHQVNAETFVGDVEEEFEDSHGNLLTRRTYEDLARQGLL